MKGIFAMVQPRSHCCLNQKPGKQAVLLYMCARMCVCWERGILSLVT